MVWSCERSTRELPKDIRCYFADRAGFLYDDLRGKRYRGELINFPKEYGYPENIKDRVNISANPFWYSKFYWENTPHRVGKRGPRRLKNTIQRHRVERTLEYISNGADKDFFKYHVLMRGVVLDSLLEGVFVDRDSADSLADSVYLEMCAEPINEVREFFDLSRIDTYGAELLNFKRRYGEVLGEQKFWQEHGGVSFVDEDDIPF